MNGFSLIFAVVVIISLAVIAGVMVLALFGGIRLAQQPPWHRRKVHHPPIMHHHG